VVLTQHELRELKNWDYDTPTAGDIKEKKLEEILEKARKNPSDAQAIQIIDSYERYKKEGLLPHDVLHQILEDLYANPIWREYPNVY
jgi:hypothetical protein